MAIETTPTSYSIVDFIKWQRDGSLDLRPPFQRYAVWRPVLKSSLIDSLLRGYPVPALFLQDRSDTLNFERRLVVIDGQQRLRTILGFVDPGGLTDRDERDDFAILKIHDEDRAGKRFKDLAEPDKQRITNARLNVYIVDGTVPDSEILEIFRRMNTYGSKLNAQELRNAEFTGYFKEVAYQLAAASLDNWLRWGLFNRQEIAEMRDAEFVSDVLNLLISGTSSSSKKTLDDLYEKYEDEFAYADVVVARFNHLIGLIAAAFLDLTTVRRLTTRMWTYSLVDALQHIAYGRPIASGGRSRPTRIDATALGVALGRANSAIDSGRLPENIERATRGAANDLGSRNARAGYLAKLIHATS